LISVDATAFIILALVFALVLVLKNLFFEPLAQAIETRESRIERAAHAWGNAEREIGEARARVAGAVQSARNEGYTLLDEARDDAQSKARAEIDGSRSEAQQQIAAARAELAKETERAVQKLESESEALAASIASRILGRDVA
jgi:F-type H+-transporting ATPase subunit b